ncbi:hypothetical protein MNBD_BACTEROID06-154 [hydrothermal vent metagenome]|uniref:Uncharacterized protein n=1 Tax=hydrothermal vent metagenome TaxID=652676 RepID=A0A3B0U9C7_9ZZZZ
MLESRGGGNVFPPDNYLEKEKAGSRSDGILIKYCDPTFSTNMKRLIESISQLESGSGSPREMNKFNFCRPRMGWLFVLAKTDNKMVERINSDSLSEDSTGFILVAFGI